MKLIRLLQGILQIIMIVIAVYHVFTSVNNEAVWVITVIAAFIVVIQFFEGQIALQKIDFLTKSKTKKTYSDIWEGTSPPKYEPNKPF